MAFYEMSTCMVHITVSIKMWSSLMVMKSPFRVHAAITGSGSNTKKVCVLTHCIDAIHAADFLCNYQSAIQPLHQSRHLKWHRRDSQSDSPGSTQHPPKWVVKQDQTHDGQTSSWGQLMRHFWSQILLLTIWKSLSALLLNEHFNRVNLIEPSIVASGWPIMVTRAHMSGIGGFFVRIPNLDRPLLVYHQNWRECRIADWCTPH